MPTPPPAQPTLFVPHGAPAADRAHPDADHLLPLYVAIGAAGQGAKVERLYAGIDDHVIAMDVFAFHPGARR